jgi:outer membrane protein assembly factor BamE (lipoprotein component of BamABCDE complex)
MKRRFAASKIAPLAGLALLAALVSACTPLLAVRGNLVEDKRLERVVVGVSNRESVLSSLGSPTVKPAFDDKTWLYIGEVTEQLAFFDPKIVDRRVLAIRFDEEDRVSAIADYDEEQGKIVRFVSRETPTSGRELSVLEQIFGNIGRFSGGGEGEGGGP